MFSVLFVVLPILPLTISSPAPPPVSNHAPENTVPLPFRQPPCTCAVPYLSDTNVRPQIKKPACLIPQNNTVCELLPLKPFGATGITCSGSWFCVGQGSSGLMQELHSFLKDIPSDAYYLERQPIVCMPARIPFYGGYFCAFTQGWNVPRQGVGKATIVAKMDRLLGHGCEGCGSVPLAKGNNPDVKGVLKVDFVGTATCTFGVCPWAGRRGGSSTTASSGVPSATNAVGVELVGTPIVVS